MFGLFDLPLPGKPAQSEMAPTYRLPTLMLPTPPEARASAVLALLMPGKGADSPDMAAGTLDKIPGNPDKAASSVGLMDWQVLLIRRSTYDGVHSGQVAFPGGKCEACDADLWDTACRETHEETGIARSSFRKLGELTSLYVPPSNFVIYPFVAVCTKPVHIAPDAREVADCRCFPLRAFDPACAVSCQCDSTAPACEVPGWQYEEYTIWGATAMILAELYRLAEAAVKTYSERNSFLSNALPHV